MPFVRVPPDSTGKQVETFQPGGGDHRQAVVIGDSVTAANVADVLATGPTAAEFGLVTRDILRRDGQELSTANLGIAGVFTQGGQDGVDDGVVFVAAVARADQVSATDGFVIQEYDGDDDDFVDTNFIRTVATGTTVINTTLYIYAVIRGRKWRVQYTNGGTAQTAFKITVAASQIDQSPAIADMDTGSGTQEVPLQGIALPAAGGADFCRKNPRIYFLPGLVCQTP